MHRLNLLKSGCDDFNLSAAEFLVIDGKNFCEDFKWKIEVKIAPLLTYCVYIIPHVCLKLRFWVNFEPLFFIFSKDKEKIGGKLIINYSFF